MDAPPERSASHRIWFALLAGIVAIVLLAPMAFGAGVALHYACALTPLGTESLWTPGVVVNSPPNGSAQGWGNGSQLGADSSSPVLGNGSAGVLEVRMNWTVFRTGMSWTVGPGLRNGCTQPYWATAAAVRGVAPSAWCLLQGPGSSSDIGLSTDNPVAGCPFLGTTQAAMFNDSFTARCSNRSAYSGGCGSIQFDEGPLIRTTDRASVTGFSVQIPLPGQSTDTWVDVGDPMNQTVLYSLSVPGCWIHETVGDPAGLSSGLLTWGLYAPFTHEEYPYCTFG